MHASKQTIEKQSDDDDDYCYGKHIINFKHIIVTENNY